MALKGAGVGANATACRREPVTETLSSVASDAISAATSGDGAAVAGCDDTCSSPTVLQADRARMQSRALASAWRCMGVSRGGRAGERPGRGNGVTESTQAAPGSCQRRAQFARKGGVAYDAVRWGAGRGHWQGGKEVRGRWDGGRRAEERRVGEG